MWTGGGVSVRRRPSFVNATLQNRTRIIRAAEADLPAISELAGVIWRACYPGIITRAQIDFMLARMYALDMMRGEIQSQGIHYDRLLVGDKLAGFDVLRTDGTVGFGIFPAGAVPTFKLH